MINSEIKKGSRYEPGEMRLEGGTGPITYMCVVGNVIEMYKVDRTFQIVPPEVSDPTESNPNMPFIATVVSNEGSGNDINSRVFIQAHESYKNFIQQDEIFNDIIKALHNAKIYLLDALKIKKKIDSDINIQFSKLPIKSNNAYTFVPFVFDLEKDISIFLMNAKLSIQNIVLLFNAFFNANISGPRFDKVITYLKNIGKCNTDLYEIANEIEPNISYIVGMRNAQEHPGENQKLVINNIVILPNEKMQKPTIQYNNEGPFDIITELNEIFAFLVDSFEVFTLHCLMEYLSPKYKCKIISVPQEYVDPKCPIKYRVTINLPFK